MRLLILEFLHSQKTNMDSKDDLVNGFNPSEKY